VTDATDGGIVVFGAPGSRIANNVIVARTRAALGGINLVDFAPYAGDYRGTVVSGNVVNASGAAILVGIGMGPGIWTCISADERPVNAGATVTRNRLEGAHMGYGYVAQDVVDWTVTGNTSRAHHRGRPRALCGLPRPSPPAAFLRDPARASGRFQREFVPGRLDALLGLEPPG
jgi:hypothetical protein